MRRIAPLAASRGPLLALAFALAGGWPGVARSAVKHPARTDMTPFAYNSAGIVGIGAAPASVTGPAVLQFQGLAGASYDPSTGHPINLGQFVVAPSSAPTGSTTLYKGTPFEIQVQAPELDRTSTVPILTQLLPSLGKKLSLKTVTENSLLLKGHLDGSVGGDGVAHVIATVDSVKLGALATAGHDHVTHYTFPIHFSQLKLPSSWVMSATNLPPRLTAHVPASPVVSAAQVLVPSTGQVASPMVSAAVLSPRLAPAPAAEMLVASPTQALATPEPSTILLFASAFGTLILARRRGLGR